MQALRKRPWWHPVTSSELEGVKKLSNDSGNISLLWEMYRNPKRFKTPKYKNTLYNHLEFNSALVTKKGLYECLKTYCSGPSNTLNIEMSTVVPRTFYLCPSGMAKGKGAELAQDDMKEWLEYNRTFSRNCSVPVPADLNSSSVSMVTEAEVEAETEAGAEGMETELSPAKGSSSAMDISVSGNNAAENALSNINTNSDGSEDAVWILKPASLTNRGFGIQVVRGVNAVLKVVDSAGYDDSEEPEPPDSADSPVRKANRPPPTENGLEKAANTRGARTGWIVQEYMERPLLISGRKFDIRCYVVLTLSSKLGLKAFFYNEAYIRTSCKKYNLSRLEDRETHLTNDAVQKNSKNYGKFEQGNKLSLAEWQSSISVDYPGTSPTIVADQIFPRIKELSQFSIMAAKETLCKSTFSKTFELLGYDYMVDDQFQPTLIEINSNPSLEMGGSALLTGLIPQLVNSTITKAVDPLYKPAMLPPSARTSVEGGSGIAGKYTSGTEEALRLIEAENETCKFEELSLL